MKVKLVERAIILVSDANTAKLRAYMPREISFPCVVYRYESGAYMAACAAPGVQITGIDSIDALAALADALENMMIDRDYSFARLMSEYGPSQRTQRDYMLASGSNLHERRLVRVK